MKYFLKIITCLCLTIMPAVAQDEAQQPAPNIAIEHAYSFATMPGGETGAVFMVIKNDGDVDDTLIKVKSDVAKKTEIHENKIDPNDGMMMMRRIKDIAVPSKESAILEPKGNHIMLMKLKEPLTLDSNFPLTLVFKKSGERIVDVQVIQPGTKLKTEEIEEGFPEKSFSHDSRAM